MRGTKSIDKCYLWNPQNKDPNIACLSAKKEDIKMSQKMVQHLYTGQEVESTQADKAKGIVGINIPKNL
jgi:hypothetical protein